MLERALDHSQETLYEAGEEKVFVDIKILDLETALDVAHIENIDLAEKLKGARAKIVGFKNCSL